MRDALIAQAGVTSGYDWNQWMFIFAIVTNLKSIDSYYACVANPSSPMTVDTFLNYVETIGGSCTTLSYPSFSNGSNANSELQAMIVASQYTSRDGWDHWNYYLEQRPGMQNQAQEPWNVCMPSVIASGQQTNPLRFLLLSPRQWLLYYMHHYIQDTLPCAGPV